MAFVRVAMLALQVPEMGMLVIEHRTVLHLCETCVGTRLKGTVLLITTYLWSMTF